MSKIKYHIDISSANEKIQLSLLRFHMWVDLSFITWISLHIFSSTMLHFFDLFPVIYIRKFYYQLMSGWVLISSNIVKITLILPSFYFFVKYSLLTAAPETCSSSKSLYISTTWIIYLTQAWTGIPIFNPFVNISLTSSL